MSLDYLYYELGRWNRKVSFCNGSLRFKKRRRNDVQDVYDNLSKYAHRNSKDVNRKINASREKLFDGIDYSGKTGMIAGIISGEHEKKMNEDVYLSESAENLKAELRKLDQEIDELSSRLSYARQRVRNIRWEIYEEKKRELFE